MFTATYSKLILLASVFGQVWAGYWDVYSHSLVFTGSDPPLNPAHLALFGFTALALTTSSTLRSANIGYRLTAYGVFTQLVAGILNEILHRTIGDPKPISPAHALLVVGMLAAQLGLVLGYSLDEHLFHPNLLIAFSFAIFWLTVSGSALYVTGVLSRAARTDVVVPLLVVSSTMVIVPAALAAPRGSLLLMISAFYPANLIPIAAMGEPLFLSLAPLSGLGLELLHRHLFRKRTRVSAMAMGAVTGFLIPLLFDPFAQRLVATLNPGALLALLSLAGAIGSVTGLGALYLLRSATSRLFTHTEIDSQSRGPSK